jgi:mRNA interferase RelE/StbE
MGMKEWSVELTPRALEQLEGIKDRKIQAGIQTALYRLQQSPDLQGKPLGGELIGYRSVRAVGQRYRIIYRLEHEKVVVLVVLVGRRKEGDRNDIYALAKRLFQSGLLEPKSRQS